MSESESSAIQIRWRLADLINQAGIRLDPNTSIPDLFINSITDDSRCVGNGSCFVAVRGTNHDGHAFVSQAARAGAAVLFVEREATSLKGTDVLRVADTREALARLAAAYYGLRDRSTRGVKLIGITGTNGKSTVAWMLRSILRAAEKSCALIGTIEYDLVTRCCPAPLTTPAAPALCEYLATARDAGAAWVVLEVSSHALDQRRCDGLAFAAGVFTNLSGDHLDYHGSMEAYFAAKRRLFDLLEPNAPAVVNRDDAAGRRLMANLRSPIVGFGLDASEAGDADVRATIRSATRYGTEINLAGRSFETTVNLSMIGRHNVQNALAAAATAEAIGIDHRAIRTGLEQLAGVPGRLQRVEPAGWPFSTFVDYAHTDAALDHVLQCLRPLTPKRLICVFGCGGDRDRTKRPRMAAAVGRHADLAWVTSDNPRTEDPEAILHDIVPGFGPKPHCRVEVEVDRARAIQAAITHARSGDTVLIAGKGHENYQLIGDQVLHFDDVEVARDCLRQTAAKEHVA
ncbi:MAG: UDP-N-acetylmuramoyl-L-alanyl-D-glutamate--2,6-diaminopimelate ligase [Planctomycetes bacterium]|nr:UDP-N-acetylmuramoyl-L-alanyl-D-glutamate--2,6-diaminopimelate ligase [Planctomycetota bacterium]